MKQIVLFCSFFILNSALANYDLSGIGISESRKSYMLSSILEHLKANLKNESDQRKLVQACKAINENLKHIDYDNYILFMDTLLTTAIINSKSGSKSFEVAGNQILTLEQKLNDPNSSYSEFSRFFIERLLKDYRPHLANRLIYNYKNPKYRVDINRVQIRQINLLNKYLGEKVNFASTSTAQEFDEFMVKSLLDAMLDLATSSFAFKEAKAKNDDNNTLVFTNLEAVSRTEPQPTDQKDPSPQEVVNEISPDEDPSSQIDELIEDVSPNKN